MKKINNTIWNKKLPSFSSLVLVTISLLTISWLSSNAIFFGAKAAAGNIPRNVQISNITDSSFTVSYTTDEKVLGTLTYGKDKNLGGIAMDDRDQLTGKPTPHRVHHITIQRLNPSTAYYLSIASGDEEFLDNKDFYHVTTAPPSLDKPSTQAPLAGKAILDDGNIPNEAIAYVKTDSSQLLSALLKPDGSYLIPLNSMRQNDFSSYVAFTDDTELAIHIISPTLQSDLSTLAGQANPVPLITLSKNYDFSLDNSSATDSASKSDPNAATDSLGLPETKDTTAVTSPQFITPKDAQVFNDQQPRFSGKALPETDVEIIINSDTPITTNVTSDTYGNWSFRPSTPLAPGAHTITINSPDASAIMQKITQSFTVHAAGTQFIEPSIITPTVAPKPTAAPTVAPTAAPTAVPTPTVDPATLTPTGDGSSTGGNGQGTGPNSLTPGNGQISPTSPPIPRTGNTAATLGIFASVISIIIGGILFSLL